MLEPSFFQRVGGFAKLAHVHEIFYDKVFADPWLRLYFEGIDQKALETQQTDFMAHVFGGPNRYCGKTPVPAHRHILITAELFDRRSELLAQSLREACVAPDLARHWLERDSLFKERLVKRSVADCERRFATDTILDFEQPAFRRVG